MIMKRWLDKLFLILLLSCFPYVVYSQNVSELKKQRLKASNDIENTAKLLEEKGSSKKSLLSNVTILSTQIVARKKLIVNVAAEVTALDTILGANTVKLEALRNEIANVKASYSSLIVRAYIHRSKYDNLIFIFSSDNLATAYKRYKILKEFSSYIKIQGERLIHLSLQQAHVTEIIKENLDEKKEVLVVLGNSARAMTKEKLTKEVIIKDLEKDEAWLLSELKRKEKFAKALDDQIRSAIEAEAKKLAKVSKTKFTPSDFPNSKGHLLWPVEGGVITSYFGEHDHPVLKGIKVKNNGVDIEVAKGRSVKAVFKGSVSKVIAIPGFNMAVLIRHGNYLTVYANLAKVNVSAGQSVTTGMVIGDIFSEPNDARSTVHFEIWKESEKIDPASWLEH